MLINVDFKIFLSIDLCVIYVGCIEYGSDVVFCIDGNNIVIVFGFN